ncbi:flavin oxidoreductase [Amylibacter marinus]|uniref:Flavin oxidoreductase n=1 Tax=Amylibacter marinus TaxID=1475483 RepID=A0ABQ5VYH8_9RHOB|nr:flavin reductase family protein [Amylibacter marinus]GLQ36339.1 flavin oxidoreductase [Amylibacter marinus]
MTHHAPTSFAPDADDPRQLRDAFAKFATGVCVITTRGATGPIGITVNSFASVSLDPALVLWSLAKSSNRFGVFAQATHCAIHILAADQMQGCMDFTKRADAFDNFKTEYNTHGVPVIQDCLASFECSAHAVHDGGDHSIFVSKVDRVTTTKENHMKEPLVFFNKAFGQFDTEARQ